MTNAEREMEESNQRAIELEEAELFIETNPYRTDTPLENLQNDPVLQELTAERTEHENEIDDYIMEQETIRATEEQPVTVVKALKKTIGIKDPKTALQLVKNWVDEQIQEIDDLVGTIYSQDTYEVSPVNKEEEESWTERVSKGTSINALQCKIELYFPEIQLTDGTYEHKIFDMFITLIFDLRITSVDVKEQKVHGIRGFHTYMKGMRASQANVEVGVTGNCGVQNFMHPHLKVSFPNIWGVFCLGSGPIATDLVDLENNFSNKTLEVILLSIPIYLQWESLDGTPYVHIKKIYQPGASIQPMPQSVAKKIVDNVCKNQLSTEFELSLWYDSEASMVRLSEETQTVLDTYLKNACLGELSEQDRIKYLFGKSLLKYSPDMQKANIKETGSTYTGFQDKIFKIHYYDLIKPNIKENGKTQKRQGFDIPDAVSAELRKRIDETIIDRTKGWICEKRKQFKRNYLGIR